MEDRIKQIFAESCATKNQTLEANLQAMQHAVEVTAAAIRDGHKLLFFGNGGSAADSQHVAAEFVGRFQKERRAFAAIALTTDTSIITALSNDYSYDMIFARQIEALGRSGDVAIGFSTSGNSANVIAGLKQAREQGLKTIGFSGCGGGQMTSECEILLNVPSNTTARIQESHMCMYHTICELVEDQLSES